MKRVIIHAGFHKSGTTALQESLYRNRDLLDKKGIHYFDFGRKAHHRLAWSISNRNWGWKNRGAEHVSPKLWKKSAKRIAKSKYETIIISSEFFSELNEEQIRKVKQDLQDLDIQILFTIRPLIKLLPSSYQQYLKYGLVADYEEWLNEVLNNQENSKVTPTFWVRHRHHEVIARWAKIFDANKTTLIIANEDQPKFLFDEINKYLGLTQDFLKAQQTGSNRSLTMEEISLLLSINRKFPKDRSWDEYKIFIRGGIIQALTDKVAIPPNKARLLTPLWACKKANEIGLEIQRGIEKLNIRTIGNLNALGNSEVPIGEPTYETDIDIQSMAEAILSFNKYSTDTFPENWLRRSYKKRWKTLLFRFLPKRS